MTVTDGSAALAGLVPHLQQRDVVRACCWLMARLPHSMFRFCSFQIWTAWTRPIANCSSTASRTPSRSRRVLVVVRRSVEHLVLARPVRLEVEPGDDLDTRRCRRHDHAVGLGPVELPFFGSMYFHWNSVFCQPNPASVIFFRSRAVVRSLPHRKTFIPYSGLAALRAQRPARQCGPTGRACCSRSACSRPSSTASRPGRRRARRRQDPLPDDRPSMPPWAPVPADIFSKPSLKFEPGSATAARASPFPAEF